MALTVNLRRLEAHNVQLNGELPVAELDLDSHDEVIRVEKPLKYDLEVQKLETSLLVQGRLQLKLSCQCVRCLKPFEYTLELPHWTAHLPFHGEEAVPISNDLVDLTPYIREDILLEFPQHPLCSPECPGLPKTLLGKAKKTNKPNPVGQDLSAWAELNKLKL
jgi:uncharacterized protein